MTNELIAIYDFEFFPYALGDVLTWNVRTAMRCEEAGKKCVNVYICLDKEYPASIYQRGLINPDNFELFFNELYSAFGTNPRLGNIYIFRQRESLLDTLVEMSAKADEYNSEAINDYLTMLRKKVSDGLFKKTYNHIEGKIRGNALLKKIVRRVVPTKIQNTVMNNLSDEKRLNDYFIKYVYSHKSINQFAEQKGYIPHLQEALGCGPDIEELIARQFKGKKIVTFHLRLRRLDVGYGGDHTYTRDSDFLEWYDFLNDANSKHPEVQFVVLGRLQEKPLEILRLPNVMSLRTFGMGLGHELSLMLKSDLFIGTSSGFAALANFSAIPYFITRMNPGSCDAYAIPQGAERLPFASENQKLIYEQETSELLMSLLESGLSLPHCHPARSDGEATQPSQSQPININEWLKLQTEPFNTSRTTTRFYKDDKYCHAETAYLLVPYLQRACEEIDNQAHEKSQEILVKLKRNFSHLCDLLPEYLLLQEKLAKKAGG